MSLDYAEMLGGCAVPDYEDMLGGAPPGPEKRSAAPAGTGNGANIAQVASANYHDIKASSTAITPIAIARSYIGRGWSPVPIPHRAKAPVLEAWGRLRLNDDTASGHFNGAPKNIGVILGNASNGLVDIDLDSPEALYLASQFLPHTDAVFGRHDTPESHWLYRAPGLVTKAIKFPGTRETLLELRSNSNTDQPHQTVFPGSTHKETGQQIKWARDGEPASVDPVELMGAFDRYAAATILARAFPAKGRHDATLSLIGLLTRAGWATDEIVRFVRAVRDAAGADRKKPLQAMARDAAMRLAADKTLFGLPVLIEAFGDKVADKFRELIGYDPSGVTDTDWCEDLDDRDEVPSVSATSRLRFLSPGQCADAPTRGYVVKGLLAPGDVACIYGAPGAGKSLISPHLGYAVAQGRSTFGMRTKQGRVFYVAAEDPHGMRGRVSALKLRHGEGDNFTLVEGVSDLLTKGSPDLAALMAAVEEHQPALIFVDTLAMAFPGLEENSAEAMGTVVAIARRLASHGSAVVLIHHDTKAGTPTPRGHSLLNGALDVALQLFARDEHGVVRGKLSKNRNGACDRDIAFRIDTEAMGEDEDGDPITFALVDELDAVAAKPSITLNKSERAAIEVLHRLRAVSSEVTETAWRDECISGRAVSSSSERPSRRKAFTRALGELTRKGAIYVIGETIHLPSDDDGRNAFDDLDVEGVT